MAYQAHIVIPTTHPDAHSVVDKVASGLAVTFGGYSRYEGTGGWDGKTGLETESHVRLVVDVPDQHEYDKEQLVEYMEIEARYVKDELDDEAVLFEIHEMEMYLV